MMWVWLSEPGQRARIVHVVDEMRIVPPSVALHVTTPCGRAEVVQHLHARRPGKSWDLCSTCEPVISTRQVKP